MQKTSIADLKPILRQAKITHQKLADLTGFYRETITFWMNGKPVSTRRAAFIRDMVNKIIDSKQK